MTAHEPPADAAGILKPPMTMATEICRMSCTNVKAVPRMDGFPASRKGESIS